MTAITQYRLIDQSIADYGTNGYAATYVYKIGADTLRVRIRRDPYIRQSHAVVELLNALRTWTDLASAPADEWHAAVPARIGNHRHAVTHCMDEIALELVDRAALILE